MAGHLFAALVGATSPYYTMSNVWNSPYEYTVTYDSPQSKSCERVIEIPFHSDPAVRSQQCHNKCANLGSAQPADCTGYKANVHTSGTNWICASLDTVQQLCSNLQNCYGVTWTGATSEQGGAGYLNTGECSGAELKNSNQYKFYAKRTSATPACALGVGVEVLGGSVDSVKGLYERNDVDDPAAGYTQIDGQNAQITWHASGCGWAVLEDTTWAPPAAAAPAPVAGGCTDDNDAANAAFGNVGEFADPAICHTAATVWGDASYCANSIFAALCAASCGGDCSDNDAALAEYRKMTGDGGPASCAAVQLPCDEVVVGLCRASCSARRLAAGVARPRAGASGAFRRAMANRRLDALARRQPKATAHQMQRRLYTVGDFKEVYYTFAPENGQATSHTCSGSPDEAILEGPTLYDVQGWDVAKTTALALTCAPQERYYVLGNGFDSYCSRENVAAQYHGNDQVVDNSCYKKCSTAFHSAGQNASFVNTIVDGESTWCAGNQADFTAATNALCLPREKCEALCSSLDECVSVDMHKTLPQCYLNTACTAETAHSDWDVLTKSRTPDEAEDAVNDELRDSYDTFTGVTHAHDLSQPVATNSRQACETECSALAETSAGCSGFVWDLSVTASGASQPGSCFFFTADGHPAEPNVTGLDTTETNQLVWRRPRADCFVSAAGAGMLDGTYTKLIAAHGAGKFLRGDNLTRLRYQEADTSAVAYNCDGWVLETNGAPMMEVDLYNCSDSSVELNVYFDFTEDPQDTNATIGAKEHSCQWAHTEGFCGDAIIAGLCTHTCGDFQDVLIAGHSYTYQIESADLAASEATGCWGDNDAAFAALATQVGLPMTGIGADTPCNYAATHPDWYNITHSPCHEMPWSPVMQALCKVSCHVSHPAPTTTAAPVLVDEADSMGALYTHNRRLQDVTTSYAGAAPVHVHVEYVHGHADDSYWSIAEKSWPIDSGACALGAIAQAGYDAIGGPMYPWTMPASAATTKRQCREASFCPELTTCALTAYRFADELDAFRQGNHSLLARSGWASALSMSDRATVFEHFAPKTLLTDTRAEAYVSGLKADFAGVLVRTVPGATRVSFPGATSGEFGDKAIVTLAASTAGGGAWAATELGRTYPTPGGFSDWTTDVVRIERFAADGSPKPDGSFRFTVYEPSHALSIFMFARDSAEGVDITTIGGSVVGPNDGFWDVTVPSVNADFVGAMDDNECVTANPCDENAMCENLPGAAPVCTCNAGFVGNGLHGNCALEPEAYSAGNQDYYFKLEHNDRMDYGWRINEIVMFSDAACTSPLRFSSVKVPWEGVDTDVYTGITHFSHYPGNSATEHDNTNLFNECGQAASHRRRDSSNSFGKGCEPATPTEAWWSAQLNLNPEPVDGSAMHGPQTIEWIVDGAYNVECVKVFQNPNHMSKALTLTRGPKVGKDCGMGLDQPRCEATLDWAAAAGGDGTATFETTCGVADTQYFGEVLQLDTTHEAGWYGSYPNTAQVPSACHCLALCVGHAQEGCRSFKFYDSGIQHCYLQSNLFSEGEGFWGTPGKPGQWPGWRSGTPGRRLFGFEPKVVVPGQPFTLTLSGVGLPFSENARKNTSPRQRVKIMEASQECKEKPPPEVAGIGCTETVRKVDTAYGTREETVFTICSPKPQSADAETATFGPLSITASPHAREYKVCYCGSQCYEPSSYVVVPGRITIAESTFVWAVDPPVVQRKAEGGASNIELTVTRPSFGSFSAATSWELKVVRSYFGCGVLADRSKFDCLEASPRTGPHDETAPEVEQAAAEANMTHGAQDAFVVQFSEMVTIEDCVGSFYLASFSLSCEDVVVNRMQAYVMFSAADRSSSQWAVLSGEQTLSWDAGVVHDTRGNPVAAGSLHAVTFYSSVSAPKIVTSFPRDGTNFNGHAITLYSSVGSITSANITFESCGEDGACETVRDNTRLAATMDWSGDSTIVLTPAADMVDGVKYMITIPGGNLTADGKDGPERTADTDGTQTIEFMYGCGLASYVATPDSAAWKFSMALEVEDAGSYAVCFREDGGDWAPIPSADSKYLVVEKLAADKTHPRGIFHNQYFSALAGAMAPLNLTVAGTRVPVPTDGKIVISSHPSMQCGLVAGFDGVEVRPAVSSDTTGPKVDEAGFIPRNGGDIQQGQAIVMAFNEAVTVPCDPSMNLTASVASLVGKDDASLTEHFTCEDLVAFGTKVVIMPESLTLNDGTYYLRVDTGSVEDLAGNPLTIVMTEDWFEVTIATDGSTNTDGPEVAATIPHAGEESTLNFNGVENVAVLVLNEQASGTNANADGIQLYDCGSDFRCSADDDVIDTFLPSDSRLRFPGQTMQDVEIAQWNVVYMDMSKTVGRDGQRFRVVVPQNFFTDGTNTGPADAEGYGFEFVRNSAGNFRYASMVLAASADSQEDGLLFGLELYSGMSSAPTYTVCYCDEAKDMTLEDLGDGDRTYRLFDDVLCAEVDPLPASAETLVVADRSIAEHKCEAKCSKGCTGPFCYCAGYEEGVSDDTLCLPPALCREACELLGEDCAAINVHDSLPQCLLLAAGDCVAELAGSGNSSSVATAVSEEHQLFVQEAGSACTNLADFTERAGSLFVTNRVEVAVDYVLHPGQDGSIEVTSPTLFGGRTYEEAMNASLTYGDSPVDGFGYTKLLSNDRIAIIDCMGTCGVSSPTTAMDMNNFDNSIQAWSDFSPFSWFHDNPHSDMQNLPDAATELPYQAPKPILSFVEHDQRYCPQGNLAITDTVDAAGMVVPGPQVAFDGTLQPVELHQCYHKCSLNSPCEGPDCHCEGHYPGYDGATSNALCADRDLCEYICSQLEGCSSIDMHHNDNRCFLNDNAECGAQLDYGSLLEDPSYSLLVKVSDPNQGQRRLSPAERRLLPAYDFGFSWDAMLRFKPVRFKSGGTFKLCFCDSTILKKGETCSTEKDYKIEVGTIHASGVSCLIAEPKLQRVSCTQQYGNSGLRCYRHMEAPAPEPPLIASGYGSRPGATAEDLELETRCMYQPEEAAECQVVNEYQSTLR